MGRLGLGILTALATALLLGATAQAAEIPPTAECTGLFKKMANRVDGESHSSPQEERRALRKFWTELFAAGCVSDPEPLLRSLPAVPRSPQCLEAATAADRFWSPLAVPLTRLARRYEARDRRLNRLRNRLKRKTTRLRKVGGQAKRIRALKRKEFRLLMLSGRLAARFLDRGTRMAAPQAHATLLTVLELASLRCVDGDMLERLGSPVIRKRGPVGKVLWRSRYLYVFSLLSLIDFSDGAAFARVSGAPEMLLPDSPPGFPARVAEPG